MDNDGRLYVITDREVGENEYIVGLVNALLRFGWLNNAHRDTFRFVFQFYGDSNEE